MVAKNDWVKVLGEGNEAFKVIGIEVGVSGATIVLHNGFTEPIHKVETLDLDKYEITSHIIHYWHKK